MRQLILGTAGHIDHGKTALVQALTGIDTDRLPEEKRRGITIDLGFANLRIEDRCEIGIVDVPGHEGFIRNMLAGATGIDLALLVVAANEGVMPQTREHLAILELLGVRTMIVALTKCDLVDAEWLELARDDVRTLLADTPFATSAIIAVSARTRAGLDELLQHLDRAATTLAGRSDADLFRLPIDRVFTVRGTGTVVTGTVWSGAAERDRVLRILPGNATARVRGIQAHGEERTRATAGQRAALALAGLNRADLKRGDALVEGNGWEAASILTVSLRGLAGALPLRTGQRVRFHLGTAEVMGRFVPFEPGKLEPGQEALAQLRLEEPVVARAGDHFVLRSWSPVTTIAGGRVLEPAARKRKRPDAEVRNRLASILGKGRSQSVEAAVWLAGSSGTPVDRLPVITPWSAADLALLDEAGDGRVRRAGNVVWHEDVIAEARERLILRLTEHHSRQPLSPGLPREELRQAIHAAAPAFADFVIASLLGEGRLESDGSTLRLAGFAAVLSDAQEDAARRIVDFVDAAGFSAPSAVDLPAVLSGRADLEDLLHYLQRLGRLTALPDRRFLTPHRLLEAAALARRELARRDGLSPADFRDLYGISRKYLIPLLEHFDRTGVTARSGEQRRLT